MGIYERLKSKFHKSQKKDVIKDVKFLQGLSESEKNKFSHLYYERNYSKGEYLFKEDFPHAVLYIIKSGSVEIFIHSKNEKIKLAELHEGDFLGEIGLFIDSSRTADVNF